MTAQDDTRNEVTEYEDRQYRRRWQGHYFARPIKFGKIEVWRGDGTGPIYLDLAELRRALLDAGVVL